MEGGYLERMVPLLWESSRPRMYPLCIAIAVVPGAIAFSEGLFDPVVFVMEALLCCALDALVCWADDCGDSSHGVDGRGRVGPARPLQRGELCLADLLAWCVILAIVACMLGLALIARSYLGSGLPLWQPLLFVAIGAACLAAALLYTVGERPYGYKGLGDLVGFVFFGPVAVCGGYFLYAHGLTLPVVVASIAMGASNSAAINLQNVRDIENDAVCGKRTTAVLLGFAAARAYHALLVLAVVVALGCSLFLHGTSPARWVVFAASSIFLAGHAVAFLRVSGESGSISLDKLTRGLTWGVLSSACGFAVAMVA